MMKNSDRVEKVAVFYHISPTLPLVRVHFYRKNLSYLVKGGVPG